MAPVPSATIALQAPTAPVPSATIAWQAPDATRPPAALSATAPAPGSTTTGYLTAKLHSTGERALLGTVDLNMDNAVRMPAGSSIQEARAAASQVSASRSINIALMQTQDGAFMLVPFDPSTSDMRQEWMRPTVQAAMDKGLSEQQALMAVMQDIDQASGDLSISSNVGTILTTTNPTGQLAD